MSLAIAAAVVAGLNVASAIGGYNSAKSQARQTIKQGEREAQNRADEIMKLASRQRVLYLHAGLELEGTPQAVVNDTYNTGIADVKAIRAAYNQQAKNIITQARANLLGGLAKAGTSLMGSMSGAGAAAGAGSSVIDVIGTAASGGNVAFTNASYGGLNSSAFIGGNSFSAQTAATSARLSTLL